MDIPEHTELHATPDAVIVVNVPAEYLKNPVAIADTMAAAFPGRSIVILPDGVTLQTLGPDDLRNLGFVRLH